LPATSIVDELLAQAALAAEHGFNGVMTSEHHGGFRGYLPNPLQVAGWLLDTMRAGWAAPCPLLLPLRPPAMVVEEVAWLAARFPARVGLGVAAGALAGDFEIMGTTTDGLTDRFERALEQVAGALHGRDPGLLSGDPAVRSCATHPVPIVTAAMSHAAARRAARLAVGMLFDSLSAPERCRELVDVYRDAGGTAACIAIKRVWIGAPPRALVDRQVDVYRSYASNAAQQRWERDELVGATDAREAVDRLVDSAARAGTDAVNVRVHVPGVAPEAVREQIEALGEVVGPLRTALASA
jgi:alkanesulfonate monooxygenase SsuD/methylene tetrahydromethanopterin reductase-like flavin-dependent oxidoreductase (luciferase family)